MSNDYDDYVNYEAQRFNHRDNATRMQQEQRQKETQAQSQLSRVVYWKLYREGQALGYVDPDKYVQLRLDEGNAV